MSAARWQSNIVTYRIDRPNFYLTWIQAKRNEKVTDMLDVGIMNNIHFDNNMWEEEDAFSEKYDDDIDYVKIINGYWEDGHWR